jgi:hypothetical protein
VSSPDRNGRSKVGAIAIQQPLPQVTKRTFRATWEFAMLDRRHVPELFEPDGAFRSIFVLDIDDAAGEAFLGLLRSGRFGSVTYVEPTADGEVVQFDTLPRAFRDLRERSLLLSPRIEFHLDGLRVWGSCYTFNQWLEFDFDPCEMTDRRLHALIEFLVAVGRALGRDCLVTGESDVKSPILAYRFVKDTVVPITNRHRPVR